MSANILQQVGNNIQIILKEKNWTQHHLANKLNISKQVVSDIVTGVKSINVSEITKVAYVLEVPIERLLDVKPEPATHYNFSFMDSVKNEKAKEKIQLLKTIINEIAILEECADD